MAYVRTGVLSLAFAMVALGGPIDGVVDYSASFSTQSTAITFAAFLPGNSTLINPGIAVGPNITSTLNALGTDYTTFIRAMSFIDVNVGVNSSLTGISVEGFSGTVRISNPGSTALVSVIQSLMWQIQALGPVSADIAYVATFEHFNTQTQAWDVVLSSSLSLPKGGTDSHCGSTCFSTDSISIPGASVGDYRVRTQLTANSVGPTDNAVPEPATVGMMACGLGVLAVVRRRLR